MFTLPGSLREAVIRPAWAAVLGAVLVGLVAVAILAGRAVIAQVSATPTPVPASPSTAATSGDGSALARGPTPGAAASNPAGPGQAEAGGAATHGGGSAGAAAGPVVVHVVGRVRTPGVVRLGPGARVQDAVTAAGGALADAELRVVNLARPVADGEQVAVPAKGSPEASAAAAAGVAGAAGAPAGAPPAARPGGTAGGAAGGAVRVDLNQADEAALDALPGIGPVTARRILEWRAAHDRFSRVEELAEVPGIGPKLLAQLTPLVRV